MFAPSHGVWNQRRDHASLIGDGPMDKVTNPKPSNSKLSVKKESPQHLKVRTDLKGGVVAAFGFICGRSAAQLFGADVINPVAR